MRIYTDLKTDEFRDAARWQPRTFGFQLGVFDFGLSDDEVQELEEKGIKVDTPATTGVRHLDVFSSLSKFDEPSVYWDTRLEVMDDVSHFMKEQGGLCCLHSRAAVTDLTFCLNHLNDKVRVEKVLEERVIARTGALLLPALVRGHAEDWKRLHGIGKFFLDSGIATPAAGFRSLVLNYFYAYSYGPVSIFSVPYRHREG